MCGRVDIFVFSSVKDVVDFTLVHVLASVAGDILSNDRSHRNAEVPELHEKFDLLAAQFRDVRLQCNT